MSTTNRVMTAEESLRVELGFSLIGNNESITLTKNDIHRAMDYHAQQFKSQLEAADKTITILTNQLKQFQASFIREGEKLEEKDKEIDELRKDASVREQFWRETSYKLESQLQESKKEIGLMEIDSNHLKILLTSCETALSNRDKELQEDKEDVNKFAEWLDKNYTRMRNGKDNGKWYEIFDTDFSNPLTTPELFPLFKLSTKQTTDNRFSKEDGDIF